MKALDVTWGVFVHLYENFGRLWGVFWGIFGTSIRASLGAFLGVSWGLLGRLLGHLSECHLGYRWVSVGAAVM